MQGKLKLAEAFIEAIFAPAKKRGLRIHVKGWKAKLNSNSAEFVEKYGKKMREAMSSLLDKPADRGADQFLLPDIHQAQPTSSYINVRELVDNFGRVPSLRTAAATGKEMQRLLYAG